VCQIIRNTLPAAENKTLKGEIASRVVTQSARSAQQIDADDSSAQESTGARRTRPDYKGDDGPLVGPAGPRVFRCDNGVDLEFGNNNVIANALMFLRNFWFRMTGLLGPGSVRGCQSHSTHTLRF
jgi:hypothetical protein